QAQLALAEGVAARGDRGDDAAAPVAVERHGRDSKTGAGVELVGAREPVLLRVGDERLGRLEQLELRPREPLPADPLALRLGVAPGAAELERPVGSLLQPDARPR